MIYRIDAHESNGEFREEVVIDLGQVALITRCSVTDTLDKIVINFTNKSEYTHYATIDVWEVLQECFESTFRDD